MVNRVEHEDVGIVEVDDVTNILSFRVKTIVEVEGSICLEEIFHFRQPKFLANK
jgi:hypothetical protein